MFKNIITAVYLLLITAISANGQAKAFKVVALGVLGGIDESNLSAYMIAPAGSNNFICMDAGTLHYGIEKAIANKVFNVSEAEVLTKIIKGYCISHSHLDHIAGLIINSPDDTAKNIYAFADCINVISTHYFTWASWANFGSEGDAPILKKYTYKVLSPGVETAIANTAMKMKAYPLSHTNLTSTAFLIQSNNNYILYLGDTGSDELEKSHNLQNLWQTIAPLIKSKQLKAIMIEVSFPDEQPDQSLFGHLTPKLLMKEMAVLSALASPDAMKGLNVVITHLKPPVVNMEKIKKQVKAETTLGLNIVFPQQGRLMEF